MTLNFSSPLIMGILNATPDSYFSASRINDLKKLEVHVNQMLLDGVDILDIGGQSTRPGAIKISADEEWSRVSQMISFLTSTFPATPISIDTFYSEVAEKALDLGVAIVNDVYAGRESSKIYEVSQRYDAYYVLMHSRGDAATMNTLNNYHNVTEEVKMFFSNEIREKQLSADAKIILDPGFGFAKDTEHNFELLNNLNHLQSFHWPILVGISRKKMIQHTLSCNADEALNGTTAIHMAALERGANILRVHDVKQAKECIQLFLALNRSQGVLH